MNASSTEWRSDIEYPVIDLLPGQTKGLRGNNKTGDHKTYLVFDSKVMKLYHKIYTKQPFYLEIHRHRYEFINKYDKLLSRSGIRITGIGKNDLVEMIEHISHPFLSVVSPS